MKNLNEFSVIGKASQVMPSLIRMICRSRIVPEEDEVIYYFVDASVKKLLSFKKMYEFSFVDRHIVILENIDPVKIRKFLRKREFNHGTITVFCRFGMTNKLNLACLSCKRPKEIIDFIQGEYLDDDRKRDD